MVTAAGQGTTQGLLWQQHIVLLPRILRISADRADADWGSCVVARKTSATRSLAHAHEQGTHAAKLRYARCINFHATHHR